MDSGGIDLRTLIEHDLRMAQAILETSRKLVLELGAAHFWTTTSNDTFKSLTNIFTNIGRMVESCSSSWRSGSADEIKLWKTAFGLYRALPVEQKKFNDHVTRRRRQRIMGEPPPEDLDIEPEILESDSKTYEELGNQLAQLIEDQLKLVANLPKDLHPPAASQDPATAANQPAPAPREAAMQSEQASAEPVPDQPADEGESAADMPL